jgi:hypothetical protein
MRYAAWLREGRLQRERERKEAARRELERQAEWEAKCDWEAAEAKEKQEREAAAEKNRLRREEHDQAEMWDENFSPWQRHFQIACLRFSLEAVIRRVGSPEAWGLLAKNDLKQAYWQAAKENHSNKGNRDEGAIKELNSLKSDIVQLGGW